MAGGAYLIALNHILLFKNFHCIQLIRVLFSNQINAPHIPFTKETQLYKILWAQPFRSGSGRGAVLFNSLAILLTVKRIKRLAHLQRFLVATFYQNKELTGHDTTDGRA